MSFTTRALLNVATTLWAASSGAIVTAAELPRKAPNSEVPSEVKAKPVPALPFFFVVDNRVTYSWMPKGTTPGAFSFKPGGGIDGTTAKSVYSFTHFDAWAYGTNFFTISMLKSGHNDPAAPCANAGVLITGAPANCAGFTDIYGLIRSTFGWNELFNTKAFSVGPLRNISFEVGVDGQAGDSFLAPSKRDFVAGLQFAFDLPYKGYFNVAPLAYKEINHNSFTQCGLFGPGVPEVTCLADGNTNYKTTWAVEVNYYMDLGFLPPEMQYFAISGRAGFYGPKGNQNEPLGTLGGGTATKIEINSEPIRLTFDASKAIWGANYSQLMTTWVAYRYWQNKYGLDHNAAPGVCTVNGVSTNSCTESTVYAGVSLKF